MLRLHWHPFSIIPRRVRIALREKALPHAEVEIDLLAGAHRGPEFRRLNPFAQVPVLEDDGLVVCESVAILEYLEERFPAVPLMPTAPAARAITRQWMLWSGDYLIGQWERWMAPVFGGRVDVATRDAAYDEIAAHLDVLAGRLSERPWLVDTYSLADVCYAPFVTVFDRVGLGDLIVERPPVAAWITRLQARPAVADTAPPPVPVSLPPRSPAGHH